MKNVTVRISVQKLIAISLAAILLLLTACSNPGLENALAPELDMPIGINADLAEDAADAPVDVVIIDEAAPIEEPALVEEPIQDETVAEVANAAVEEAVEDAVVADAVTEQQVEEIVEVAEPAAPEIVAVEVEGMAVDPTSIEPIANATGYYKSFDGGRDMTLALRPNGNFELRADLHDGNDAQTYIGTWVTGEDTFTIRLAGVEETHETMSDSFVFKQTGDYQFSGQFMGFEVSFHHFKALAAGTIVPNFDQATATNRYTNQAYAGTYKAMLVAFDAPGRDATIVLHDDGTLEWTTIALNRNEPSVELGTWSHDDAGTLSLVVTERDGRMHNPARAFSFSLQNGVLHSDTFNASIFALSDLFVGSAPAVQTGNN